MHDMTNVSFPRPSPDLKTVYTRTRVGLRLRGRQQLRNAVGAECVLLGRFWFNVGG